MAWTILSVSPAQRTTALADKLLGEEIGDTRAAELVKLDDLGAGFLGGSGWMACRRHGLRAL